MPDGFVARYSDSSGLTWRETGSMPCPLTNAVERLSASMAAQGYRMKHDIFDPRQSVPDRHLFLWTKPGEEATVMVWADGEAVTGLSWGVTKPEAAATAAAPAEAGPTAPAAPPSGGDLENDKTPTQQKTE